MLRVCTLAWIGLWGSHAHADWLVELSEEVSQHHSSPTELIYPRPGLPALAEPGELIIARVRVPAPLMPAPGIQQARALRGWSAELVGHSTAVDEGAEHRYALRVLDVRADAASGLVFRATVRVPPWAAPGTYTFRIDSPGSVVAAAPGAVRVLVPGRPPIVAHHAEHQTHANSDVDVWLSGDTLPIPLAGSGVPWLDTRIDARFAFEMEPIDDVRPIGSYVFLESRERIAIDRASWYPATDVRPAGVRPSILARVEGLPSVRREGTCSRLEIEAPTEAVVHEPFLVRAADARAVGWAFEEDGALYSLNPDDSRAEVALQLRWMGVQEIHALAVEDGCARRGQAAVRVEPALRMGCSAADPSGILWFFSLLCTIAARRYKPKRNTLADVERPTSQP